MTTRLIRNIFVATALACALPSVASAQSRYSAEWERPDASNWPLATIERPLTLTRNMLELSGNSVRLDMSNEQFGRPLSIAPDLHFGVTSRLTLGIIHDVGVCALGGCGYNDGGVAMRVGFYEGQQLSVAGTARIQGSLSIFGASAGFLMRIRTGAMAFVVAPSLYAGIRGRDEVDGRSTGFDVPVHVQLQLGDRIMGYVATGLTHAEFNNFGSTARVPFGFGGSLALTSRLELGGELYIHNFVGPSPGKNTDRTLSLRLALRI